MFLTHKPSDEGFSVVVLREISMPRIAFAIQATVVAGFLIFMGWNPAIISCEPQETNIQCAERARDLANR